MNLCIKPQFEENGCQWITNNDEAGQIVSLLNNFVRGSPDSHEISQSTSQS